MNANDDKLFISRLKQHPKLRKRMESLLDVVENTAGDYTKADDAERHVIEELRKQQTGLHGDGNIHMGH